MNTKSEQLPHFGQCTCVYSCLVDTLDEDIIFLIDGYVHRSEYVETAIAATLVDQYRNRKTGEIKPPQAEILRRLKIYNGLVKHWRFAGDENKNATIVCDGISIVSKAPISGDAAVCTLSLGRESNLELRVNNILLNTFFDLTWDGADLTPFAKRSRRYIKGAITIHDFESSGQKYDPVDAMCDVAHAAIWIWFHGGEISAELLPQPIKHKSIGGGDILADYYNRAVQKMYKNDDRFQRPHRKTAGITSGMK